MRFEGKAVVAQGGGPTTVINQSLVGVVLESRKFPQVTHVYGAENGVEGIVNDNFYDLSKETTGNLNLIAQTPSSALLSTRVKPDANYCKEMFNVLKSRDVRYFFYIGGNDSADTVRIVNEEADKSGYEFRAIHIPKTIDNDLMLNDHTPGYGSAAKFVSRAFIGANLDMRSLPGVYIGVVMGRHAGFLTAAAAMAKKFPDDGPHLIYLPERAFSIDKFLNDVKNVYNKYGRCIIAVSEGIADAQGVPMAVKLQKNVVKDSHGNVELHGGAIGELLANGIKSRLGIKRVRCDTFGYIQRSYIDSISEVDQREAREVGEVAVHCAVPSNLDGSLTIKRVGNYAVDYKLEPFDKIAGKTRVMPDNFINRQENYVTNDFIEYCRPLLGNNLKEYSRIRAPKVAKLK